MFLHGQGNPAASIAVFQPISPYSASQWSRTFRPPSPMPRWKQSPPGCMFPHLILTRLYDEVNGLRTPAFAAQRMRLPCLSFKIGTISRNGSEFTFHVHVGALGAVEISTRRISWGWILPISFTLESTFFSTNKLLETYIVKMKAEEDASSELDEFLSFDSFPDLSSTSNADPLDDASLPSPSTVSLEDAQTAFLARLVRLFGALSLAPTRRNTRGLPRGV